jgi:hypothetical protein
LAGLLKRDVRKFFLASLFCYKKGLSVDSFGLCISAVDIFFKRDRIEKMSENKGGEKYA